MKRFHFCGGFSAALSACSGEAATAPQLWSPPSEASDIETGAAAAVVERILPEVDYVPVAADEPGQAVLAEPETLLLKVARILAGYTQTSKSKHITAVAHECGCSEQWAKVPMNKVSGALAIAQGTEISLQTPFEPQPSSSQQKIHLSQESTPQSTLSIGNGAGLRSCIPES